jgi:hypothetical protein
LTIASIKDINTVISHFNKYPLKTCKKYDFLLFERVIGLILNKEHLTTEGLRKIISIRASMNNGLTPRLKTAFPNLDYVERPNPYEDEEIEFDPNWLIGFTEGDGSFSVVTFKSNTKTGFAIHIGFILTQHSRDINLMNSLVQYFNCGYVF